MGYRKKFAVMKVSSLQKGLNAYFFGKFDIYRKKFAIMKVSSLHKGDLFGNVNITLVRCLVELINKNELYVLVS